MISALKSLQGKIKTLEEERDVYKAKYERLKESHENEKLDLEQQIYRHRTKLTHERDTFDRSKAEIEILNSRLLEQVKALREDNEKLLELRLKQEQQIGTLQVRVSELDSKIRANDHTSNQQSKQLDDMRLSVELAEKARDEIQRSLVKELHRREKLEDVNEQLDKTVKDLIAIQKELVQKSIPPGLGPQISGKKNSLSLSSSQRKKKSRQSIDAQWLPGTTQNSFHHSMKSMVPLKIPNYFRQYLNGPATARYGSVHRQRRRFNNFVSASRV